ncbi:hypothetical protein CcaCcLH18_11764 [Colletotrichum camelliae]|nr:hypothetical protein CcaCcLH18_11764 [Colletotrichum camelliae]
MVKKGAASNAWEDDWETQADRLDDQPQQSEPQIPLSKAERLAQHAESNRKLWEEADSPAPLHFIDSQPSVPMATGFKPQVKVLSRKPAPQMIARRDPVTGLSQLSLADDDDDKTAEKKPQLTPEEIRARQQRELEEKQRRYEEARAKIFGESNPSSGASSPGTVTPPRGPGDGGRGSQRGRGRLTRADLRAAASSTTPISRPEEASLCRNVEEILVTSLDGQHLGTTTNRDKRSEHRAGRTEVEEEGLALPTEAPEKVELLC